MKDIFPFYRIGHFINQPGNPTEFEITHFETMAEPEVNAIHKHSFYEIIWVEQGQSRQHIDYQEYDVGPGTLFFISPGQVHSFEAWQPLQGGSILFTENFLLQHLVNKEWLFELTFLDNFYANPSITPDAASYAELHQTIVSLAKERVRADYAPAIAQSMLHVLLAQVQRYLTRHETLMPNRRYLVLYKQFRGLLEAHFRENKLASFYAEQLNITQHHLNEVLKQVTGGTTRESIHARVMLEARRWLTFTDKTVTEVAYGLGFEDASHFAKLFRAVTGLAPTAFRMGVSETYRIS